MKSLILALVMSILSGGKIHNEHKVGDTYIFTYTCESGREIRCTYESTGPFTWTTTSDGLPIEEMDDFDKEIIRHFR